MKEIFEGKKKLKMEKKQHNLEWIFEHKVPKVMHKTQYGYANEEGD